jgi:signal transduction histidine kinase
MPARAGRGEKQSMKPHDKVNILMVDDQPGKLLSYEAILGELGENLVKASSGREALELLLKMDFAVVLMDVSMPDLDGFELADLMRQHPRYEKTAVIFISAVRLTDLDRLSGYKRGAVDYISVPVIPELLRAKVSVFAELYRKAQQLENLNRELHHLSRKLILMQDKERRRIARELHDGLNQGLCAAKMLTDRMSMPDFPTELSKQAGAEVSAMLDDAIQQIRNISHLLHPPMLDEIGLLSALQGYLEGITKRSGVETFIEAKPREFPRLSAEMETTVFRIIQEALTNVFRHSGARKTWVKLEKRESELVATVRDDGKGISSEIAEFQPASIGIGIGGMRERVKEFGGELQLRNTNPGTLVEVVIPLRAADLPRREISVAAL